MKRRIQRNALNRGTAVHLGGARVRFVWACGCKRVETVTSPAGPMSEGAVALLVSNWRANGVVLAQCKQHPDWYEKLSQVARLNEENPTEETSVMTIKSVIDKYPNFDVWPRGGGCEAYGHPLDNGGHILITAADGNVPELPAPDDQVVTLGRYDSNADQVELIERCPVTDLEKTIDRMIRKGSVRSRR